MAISLIARFCLVSATIILTLSDFYIVTKEKLPIVPAQSEFFAYTWIYATRWSAGEFTFQPHGQILFPVFAILDRIFGINDGIPSNVMLAWDIVGFCWSLALALLSVALIFLTMKTKSVLEYLFVATIFILAVPATLSELAFFSMGYHSLALPTAFMALPLWNRYADFVKKQDTPSIGFSICLASYLAFCLLGKPTFLAYAAPFFGAEVIRAAVLKRPVILFQTIMTGCLACLLFVSFLVPFYGGFAGFVVYIKYTHLYMTSQANWYDAAKGSNWLAWYYYYVVKVAGPFAAFGSVAIVACTFLPRLNRIITIAALIGLLSSMFFLYHRSQAHGHPEFIAHIAVLVIALFRNAGLERFAIHRFERPWSATALSCGSILASIIAVLIFFPLPMNSISWTQTMTAYNKVIAPVSFSDDQAVKTVLVSIYPNVLYGDVDIVCRGSREIFAGTPSLYFEQKFGNFTCITDKLRTAGEFDKFNHIVFRKEISDPTIEAAAQRTEQEFPYFSGRIKNCRSVGQFSTFGVVQCELTASP